MTCRLSAALNNGVSLLKATDALRVNAFINQRWADYGGSPFADIDDIAPKDGVNISSCRPGCGRYRRRRPATESKNRRDFRSGPFRVDGYYGAVNIK